jgi:RuvB-like protein 1
LIVKTEGYTRDQIGKVIQLRATVEGLKLGEGVTDRLAAEGERGSLRYGVCFALEPVFIAFASRYVVQLLTPALILAQLAGRTQIELEDIGEMTDLFLDSKTSASNLAKRGGFDGGKMW